MSIIDTAKELANLASEVGKIDLYKQAVEMMSQITEVSAKNFELTKQVADLQKSLEVKGRISYDVRSHTYQLAGKGVYCATCYDSTGVLQRLYVIRRMINTKRAGMYTFTAHCHKCGWKHLDYSSIPIAVLDWPEGGQPEPDTNPPSEPFKVITSG